MLLFQLIDEVLGVDEFGPYIEVYVTVGVVLPVYDDDGELVGLDIIAVHGGERYDI